MGYCYLSIQQNKQFIPRSAHKTFFQMAFSIFRHLFTKHMHTNLIKTQTLFLSITYTSKFTINICLIFLETFSYFKSMISTLICMLHCPIYFIDDNIYIVI